jgi:hypothetical protein
MVYDVASLQLVREGRAQRRVFMMVMIFIMVVVRRIQGN